MFTSQQEVSSPFPVQTTHTWGLGVTQDVTASSSGTTTTITSANENERYLLDVIHWLAGSGTCP